MIYVDADACPVKEQIYRAAARYGMPVTIVANGYMRVPDSVTGSSSDIAEIGPMPGSTPTSVPMKTPMKQ